MKSILPSQWSSLFCVCAELSLSVYSILLKVCSLLRNRAQEIRDIARNTLTKIIEALGAQYLQYILKEMQSTLVHGYQVTSPLFLTCSLLLFCKSWEEWQESNC